MNKLYRQQLLRRRAEEAARAQGRRCLRNNEAAGAPNQLAEAMRHEQASAINQPSPGEQQPAAPAFGASAFPAFIVGAYPPIGVDACPVTTPKTTDDWIDE